MSSAQIPTVNQATANPSSASVSSTSTFSTTTPPSSQATGSTTTSPAISGQQQPPIHLATPVTSQSTTVATSTSNHIPPQTTLPLGSQSQASKDTFIRLFRRFYSKSKPKEWTPFWLTPHGLLGFLLFDLSLIGGIIAVKIGSHSKHGLADVSNSSDSDTVLNYPVGQSLWWTFFPVLIFQIFGLYFAAIIDSRGERQPFVELRGAHGSDTKHSILLDYRSMVAAVRPGAALRNKHWMLSVSFLAALLVSLFLSSLASHLLIADVVPIVDATLTHLSSTFDPYDFGYDSELTPVLDGVSSTLVYGGLFPAWTTSNMSFQSFDRPAMSLKPSTLATYLTNTTAYSARLQCRNLAEGEYVFTQPDDGNGWTFGARDHGCDFSPTAIILTTGFKNYVQTFSNVSCSLDAGLSRLFVLAAHTPDPDTVKPSEVTVLACRTAYFRHSGTLNVTYTVGGSSAVINSFQEHEHGLQPLDNPMPVYYQNFERQLHQPSIFDNTATTSATDFGRLILAHARKQAPQSPFSPRAMLNATSVLFTAAHAVMVSSFLWQAGAADTAGNTVQGSLTIPTVRLVVVDPIANVLLSVLAVLAVLTIWISIDVINNETSLFEEPKGLLGSAILLHESDVNAFASDLRRDVEAAQDGRVLAHAREPRRLWGRALPLSVYRDDVLKKKWKVENWHAPSNTKIVAG
ncbi:hypothetical protein CLCR_06759 [Cladophialophora carrionii]|uniref:Uncharacterized protein n=1 Tax=Cladophialophora carrionii TaxID=86049 RepID=A0A1C1CPN4_9EURO|nr:hypothetical protein CLCR_06759 [Cladophialophora carrionii]